MVNSLTVQSFVAHFDEYVENTRTSRQLAERDRDFFDHKQLSETEAQELRKRGQPDVVFNRIQPKIMYMLGQQRSTRTDPKAYPRSPAHADAAEAITDALRYVDQNADFDTVSSDCFENFIIEGIEAAIVEVNPKTLDIEANYIPWDRFYFDVHSRRPDFSDCTKYGIVIWKDLQEAKLMFPEHAGDFDNMFQDAVQEDTFDDKPKHKLWTDPSRKRVMILQEFFVHDGVWHEVIFCKGTFLKQPQPSAYLDENGEPECPIIAASCFVDRDGKRYGVVRAYIDAQKEINKRRSKALHILNSNQTISEKGSIPDKNEFKRQKNNPAGDMELEPGALTNKKFNFVNNNVELQTHLQFLQESKAEIDAVGANAALTGKQDGAISGRALQARQHGGMVELGLVFDRHRLWERRVYRALWSRIKQFWREEKWIRVTDSDDAPKFVGLNQPVTLGQQVEEHARQTGEQIPLEMMHDPRLNQVVEVRNNIAEIDTDIIIEETQDTVTLQGEMFEMFTNAVTASGQQIPLEVWLELMPNMPNKKFVLDKLKGDPDQQAANQQEAQRQQQMQDAMLQTQMEKEQADIDNKNADTAKKMADTEHIQVETALAVQQPPSGGFFMP